MQWGKQADPETIFKNNFDAIRCFSAKIPAPPHPPPQRVMLEHPPVPCTVFPEGFLPPNGFFMLPPCCGRLPFFFPSAVRPPSGLAWGFAIYLGARLSRSNLFHPVAWVASFSPVQRKQNLCSRGWGFGASAPGALYFSPNMGANRVGCGPSKVGKVFRPTRHPSEIMPCHWWRRLRGNCGTAKNLRKRTRIPNSAAISGIFFYCD